MKKQGQPHQQEGVRKEVPKGTLLRGTATLTRKYKEKGKTLSQERCSPEKAGVTMSGLNNCVEGRKYY